MMRTSRPCLPWNWSHRTLAAVLLIVALPFSAIGTVSNPRIVEHPESQYVAKNEPATLNCKAEGDPPPVISWYRDGQPVITANENPSSHRMLLPSGQLFFLRIINNKNSRPDVGTYYCNATNPDTRVSAISRNATLEIAVIYNEFREQPRSAEVAVGTDAVLDCRAPRGEPEPRVRWRKDSDPLKTSDRISISETGSLRIKDARKEDSGVYVCIAYNMGGDKESSPARFSVREKPKISEGPKDVLVQENADVLFNCRASGEPEPMIIWKKVDDQMPQGRLHILEDRSLKIERARQSDEGVYVCRAENSVGWHEAEAKLTVHSQPSFIVTPRDKVVGVGRKATFRCEVTGNPVPAVFWNKESSQTLMFPNQDHGRMSVSEDGTLVIEPVQKEDAGEYICKGLSIAGSAYAKARLDVKEVDPRPPPIIHQGPQNQTLPINSIALLQCLASGEPAPSVRWYRNNRVLPLRDPRFTLLDSGTLQISDLRKADTGWYTCKAVSETGETSWSAGLLVETPTNPSIIFHRTPEPSTFPGPPSKPTVSDIGETSVRLSWRANPSHGASPVHSYTVEYVSHETGEGWVVATDSVAEQSFVVRSLRQETTYMFLVRARNSHGLSLPSQVTAAIRTKGFSGSAKPTTIPFDPSVIRDKLSAAGSVIQLLSVEPLSSKSAKVSWEIRRNQRFVEGVHVRRRAIQADDSGSSQRDELGQDFIDITVDGSDATSFILEGLSPFTRYEINVQPFYRSVIGTESSSQYITTSEDVPSAAPSNIRAKLVENTTLHLMWDAPAKHQRNGIIRGYKIYLQGNESKFSREIAVNASLQAVYIHQIIREMTYRIQMSAVTIAEGVRSEYLIVGSAAGSVRQDVLREPWFLATLLGSIGGILWLIFCIFTIWLCRRRRALMGRKKIPKNSSGYSGTQFVNQKSADIPRVGGTLYNVSLGAPNYAEKELASHADAAQYAANAVKEAQLKEAMYGVGNLQSTPCMKSFYNKALLSSTESHPSSESKQSSGGPQVPQISPSVLQVTGGAFRPVQQSTYIIRPQGSAGGTSTTDSCVKPDASSTSSNNETNTNNDNSGDHGGMCYDSGHPFEQSEFMNSPMSEYGPGVEQGFYDVNALVYKQPMLFLPPPPEHPPPSDIGTPPDSPTDSLYGRYQPGRRQMHSDCERPAAGSIHQRPQVQTSRFGTCSAAALAAARRNPGAARHHGTAEMTKSPLVTHSPSAFTRTRDEFSTKAAVHQPVPTQQLYCKDPTQSPNSQFVDAGIHDCTDVESEDQRGCYSPVSSVSEMDIVTVDEQTENALWDGTNEISESDLSSSEEEEPFIGGDIDFASAVARAAEMAGMTVVGSTVTDSARNENNRARKPPRVRRRPARCTSPYSTDSCYEGPDTAPRRPYPKSERRRQLRQQQGGNITSPPTHYTAPLEASRIAANGKPRPPPIAIKPGRSPVLRVATATVSSTRRESDADSMAQSAALLSAFDSRDTQVV